MASVVGTAVGSRSGSGSFTITPPAGATSYLAAITSPIANLTPPTGWTLVGEYNLGSAGSKTAVYKGTSSAGSSWSTTIGTLLSDYPVVGVVTGYDFTPASISARVLNPDSAVDPYPAGPGATAGPGIQVRLMAAQSATNGTIAYPVQAPDSRNTTKGTSTAGFTNYVAVAHSTHTDTGFTGEAVWGTPGAAWDYTTVGIHLDDPAATAAPFTLATSGQWAGGTSATVTTSTSSTITGTAITPDDVRIKYVGCRCVYNIGSGWYRPQELIDNDTVDTLPPYAARFVTNSQTFEVNFRQRSDLPSSAMKGVSIRLKVDGQWVTHRQIYLGVSNTGYPPAITTPTVYTASTAGWFKVDFGSAATRTVEVWLTTEFASIKIPTGTTLSAAALPGPPTVVIGDSLIANDQYGTGDYTSSGMSVAATYTSATGPLEYAAQWLGFDNIVNAATGAGCYQAVGEGQKWDDARLVTRDIASYDPRVVFIGTGLNDFVLPVSNGQTPPTDTVVGNAAADLYAKIQAACPNATIVVFGSPDATLLSTSYSGWAAHANGVYKAKAAAAGVWFFDLKAGVLYGPTGSAVYSPGTGWYHTSWEGPDQIHPSAQGSEDMGAAFADVFRQALVLNTTRVGTATPSYFVGSSLVSAMYVGTAKVYG